MKKNEKIWMYQKSEITAPVNLQMIGLTHLSLPPCEELELTIKEKLNRYPYSIFPKS
jgi:hypothetical protein